MSKIAIIHFAPLEFYPPIQNLLNEIAREGGNTKVEVFTTHPVRTVLLPFRTSSERIKLIRIGKSDMSLRPLSRYFNYALFFSRVLLRLVWCQYKKIMYFETISAWPAYLYKRFFGKRCEIFIHYHEYTSPDEYRQGMKLVRYFHRLERWLYPRAVWVSHTNVFRMDRFKADIFPVIVSNAKVIPNYPPLKWQRPPKRIINSPLKIVYIGALSLGTMYTRVFSEWVVAQNGKVIWDIFSYNHSAEVTIFIKSLPPELVQLHEGVTYDQLPDMLEQYDVGVVLYTGHIPNYVYNAPNKLFEYLACGLDVWFPRQMMGSNAFIEEVGFPKVLPVDFTDLCNFDLSKALERRGTENRYTFFCEDALMPLVNKLTNK